MDCIIAGPLAYRTRGILNKGQSTGGHTHNFDHVTLLIAGAVKLTIREADGTTVRTVREYRSSPGYRPKIVILANCCHEFEALEDGTETECWYLHRGPDGEIVEKFWGNQRAYG